jgi:hypothetical protein
LATDLAGVSWALYRVEYSVAHPEKSDGCLLYIKPCYYEKEPAATLPPLDERRYAAFHQDFPHEPTADQFFSEEQFESYRALGMHILHTLSGGNGLQNLEQLFQAARKGCKPQEDQGTGALNTL